MDALKKSIRVPMLIPVALLCVFLGYQATANRVPVPTQPAVIATIDLERLFEGLEERAAADARLQDMANQDQEKLDKQKASLDELEEEIKAFADGSPRQMELANEWEEQALLYRAWVEHRLKVLDREKGLVMMQLYASVKKAVRSMAESEGYDIVYLNDSLKGLQTAGEQLVVQQISGRRMLYANEQLDITDDLLASMNNNFRAGIN